MKTIQHILSRCGIILLLLTYAECAAGNAATWDAGVSPAVIRNANFQLAGNLNAAPFTTLHSDATLQTAHHSSMSAGIGVWHTMAATANYQSSPVNFHAGRYAAHITAVGATAPVAVYSTKRFGYRDEEDFPDDGEDGKDKKDPVPLGTIPWLEILILLLIKAAISNHLKRIQTTSNNFKPTYSSEK